MRPSLGRSLGRALVGLAALAASAFTSSRAAAYGDPNLDWWTIETKHFHIHYPRSVEPVATRVARLAETIHDRVSITLGYAPSAYTEIVLTDDTDSANGSATALPFNTIRLYVTAPDDLSALGDYDDWYLALLTHEYTHILHTDNISGVPAIVNVVLGKTLSPNQVQPRWILEGLAVVSESEHTSGGRIRSSLFDMFLRADVLADNIAGIDQFSSNAIRWPQGNLWYLYGSRFLRWITDIYGPNTMRAVAADYGASLVPWGINRAIRRATGRTYVELYEGFKDHLRRLYAEQMAAVEKRGLREGTRLTTHGRSAYYPRFAPREARAGDAEEIVYYKNDLHARAGLYRIPLAAAPNGKRSSELVARTEGSSSAAFMPSGDLVFHSIAWYRNVYPRDDLFRLTRGATSPQGDEPARRRLTVGHRAYYADVSPDGKRMVFNINAKGTTFLDIADIDPQGELVNRRDLVPSGPYEQAYTPRFSPDGKTVAYSVWKTGGYRDIRLVDVATGAFTEVTHDRALDMTPVWSPDGKTLYFASDRTGILNIYAYDLARKTFAQVTNVRTGAVQPAVSTDGKTLVYVGYTTAGYDLFSMPIEPSRFLAAAPPPTDRPDPLPEPIARPYVKHRYNPLPTLRPQHYLVNYKPGSYSANAITLDVTGTDVVGLHSLSMSLTADPSAPSPNFSINYSYDRLPFNFGMNLFHYVTPRGGYVVNDTDTTYNEYTTGITTSISYTAQEAFSSHNLGLSFSVANFKGDLPVGNKLDPYATAHVDPPKGNINVLHVGYSFSNVESSLEAAGPVRGASFSIGLDYADTYTGSSYSVRAASMSLYGYIPMPWPGHQVLALHTAGAISTGSYPRGDIYSVGGYDLQNNSLPSTVVSGIFNGSFVLRGYPPHVYAGSEYVLQNAEYRIPIWKPDRGISSLPLFLRRIDGNVFWDWGGAFERLDFHKFRFFSHGAIIYSPDLHSSVGAEIWLGTTLGYAINTQFRIGYAYGFSAEAVRNGQPYFVASGAF